MGDKHDNKSKKGGGTKLTKKELKALNHQKLMDKKGASMANSNVIEVNFNREKDKKAA